jgi:hypothetical protein
MMESGFDHERLSFLDKGVSPAFELRLVTVEAGCERAYDEREWVGAIVVVERGAIDLDCVRGASTSFQQGAVLFLVGLPLRALVNRGIEPALLSAVARRRR